MPPRVQYVMDRFEMTKKMTRRQKQQVDHHFLLQREFNFMAQKDARAAKKADK